MEGLMDFFSQNSGPTAPTDFNSTNNMIDVMEISSTPHDPALKIESRHIHVDDLSGWLQMSCQPGQRKSLRLVLVPLISTRNPYRLDISQQAFELILKEFGLEKMYSFANTTNMTFDIVPKAHNPQHPNSLDYYSIVLEHFFGLYMAADPGTDHMHGLVWTSPRPMGLFRNAVTNLQLGKSHFQICTVEKRTGHQGWDMIAFPSAEGELSDLSAQMSGLATAITANRRLNGMVDEILKVLKNYASKTHASTGLAHNLLNLSNREEMKLSLELTKDSRTVATASQRDSSSMKALAAVTVLFLPGKSIASLFSMSMFDWKDEQQIVSKKFWIYWIITIPLTLLTVTSWLIWDHRRTVLARIKDKEALKGLIAEKV
ncbi:MAG: hypothetical protein Q9160_005061 [Pyrenula sp. 1 TL-2023]